jgi:predicted transcriptional regulator
MSGRAVRDALAADGHDLALTTVLTVLSRMEQKGAVSRVAPASGTGVAFTAKRSEFDTAADSMVEALATVSDRAAVLQRFTGSLSPADLDALRDALQ